MPANPPLTSPFGSEPFNEVPLTRAPLARTLTQIRFPNQSALSLSDDVPNRLALALSPSYPVFNVGHEVTFVITPDGVSQNEGGGKVWKVGSSDETWQVSFAPNFLSLHTSRYTSRDDFCQRLAAVWELFAEVVGRPAVQRIGFRYINRVSDREFLDTLPQMVRPEVMGSTFSGGGEAPIARSLTENLYVLGPQDQLLARWGIMPPGETFDPDLPSPNVVSWLLDLDSFKTFSPPAASELDVPAAVKSLGKVGYRYFRWAVTDDFLRYFGGEV